MKHFKPIFALIITLMMGASAQAAVNDIFTTEVNGVNMQFKVVSENGRFWSVSVYGTATQPAISTNTEGDVVIPDKFTYGEKTCTVIRIGYYSFYRCNKVTSFEIPKTVLDIEEFAFSQCTGITEITIPLVNYIERRAFMGCTSLEKLVLLDSNGYTLTENNMRIEEGVFYECPLKEVINYCPLPCFVYPPNEADAYPVFSNLNPTCVLRVPEGKKPTYINSNWNYYFEGKIMEIGESVEPLQEGDTFTAQTTEGVDMLFMVTGDNTVMTCYDDDNDYACVQLSEGQTSITIPEIVMFNGYEYTVTMIGNFSFCECSSLESVTIPSTVTEIGESAFEDCEDLTSVTISEGVKTICDYAFYGTGLTSISIPSSVEEIGNDAFEDCEDLTSVTISEGVKTIGDYAFYETGLTSLIIPSSVEEIGDDAFGWCPNLVSITVDANNDYYDSREECNAIIDSSTDALLLGCKNTIIPDGVTSIEVDAFSGCTGLTSIDIPESVETIGWGAFSFCIGLTSITIPSGVTDIFGSSFYGCENLSVVVCQATTPPNLGDEVFEGISQDAVLYVPSGTIDEYEDSAWNDWFTTITTIPSIVEITIGETGVATLSSVSALDFTQVDGLEAYIVSDFNPSNRELTLTLLEKTPACTGLLIKGGPGTYHIPSANYMPGVENMLVPILDDITLQPTETVDNVPYTNFVLTKYEGEVGFFRFEEAQKYPAGKAYLQMKTSLVEAANNNGQSGGVAGFKLVFDDDDATGIVELSDVKPSDNLIYNLSGQRVNHTQNGVYIVNGKKVLVK